MGRAGVIVAVVAVVAAAFAAAAFALRAASLTVRVNAWSGSGVTGKMVLTPVRDGVAFSIQLDLPPSLKKRSVTLLARLNRVSCAKFATLKTEQAQLKTLQFPLAYVVLGRTRGTLPVKLSRLRDGSHSIEIAKATTKYTVVACGDIPRR
jgi:hypothetical protein